MRGEAGDVVTLRHAEVLEHGELATAPLRAAKATDIYTLCGGDNEEWAPRFTLHGFRYAEVTGWPSGSDPIAESVVAEVLHTDMERTGWFTASDPLVDRLHQNVVLGYARQRGRRAHGLPAARRAARVDRRPAGLRTDRGVSSTTPPGSSPRG